MAATKDTVETVSDSPYFSNTFPVDSNIVFFSMPLHVLVDFVILPPGHGRSVTDF